MSVSIPGLYMYNLFVLLNHQTANDPDVRSLQLDIGVHVLRQFHVDGWNGDHGHFSCMIESVRWLQNT